jgi:hypothetical protein
MSDQNEDLKREMVEVIEYAYEERRPMHIQVRPLQNPHRLLNQVQGILSRIRITTCCPLRNLAISVHMLSGGVVLRFSYYAPPSGGGGNTDENEWTHIEHRRALHDGYFDHERLVLQLIRCTIIELVRHEVDESIWLDDELLFDPHAGEQSSKRSLATPSERNLIIPSPFRTT